MTSYSIKTEDKPFCSTLLLVFVVERGKTVEKTEEGDWIENRIKMKVRGSLSFRKRKEGLSDACNKDVHLQ